MHYLVYYDLDIGNRDLNIFKWSARKFYQYLLLKYSHVNVLKSADKFLVS